MSVVPQNVEADRQLYSLRNSGSDHCHRRDRLGGHLAFVKGDVAKVLDKDGVGGTVFAGPRIVERPAYHLLKIASPAGRTRQRKKMRYDDENSVVSRNGDSLWHRGS
jgi:hypothetical protein